MTERVLSSWVGGAACAGKAGLFFPPPGEGPKARFAREEQARRVCWSCTVMRTCRQWARDNHEQGFWGGESDDDRFRSEGPATGRR